MPKPVIYPMIQLVVVILYTKYELSILYSCGDIFDKNVERKKKDIYKDYLYTKYEHFILNDYGDTFDKKVLRKDGRTGGLTE